MYLSFIRRGAQKWTWRRAGTVQNHLSAQLRFFFTGSPNLGHVAGERAKPWLKSQPDPRA
jgi:hypothetical protein